MQDNHAQALIFSVDALIAGGQAVASVERQPPVDRAAQLVQVKAQEKPGMDWPRCRGDPLRGGEILSGVQPVAEQRANVFSETGQGLRSSPWSSARHFQARPTS